MSMRTAPLAPLLLCVGCVVWIREPEAYREEIVELVEVRDEAISKCYDGLLERRQHEAEKTERAAQGPYADIGPAVDARLAGLHGKVAVHFSAAKETGEITATPVPEATTAPPEVAACVLDSLDGLKLEPADERDGRITLVFQMKSGKHKSVAATE